MSSRALSLAVATLVAAAFLVSFEARPALAATRTWTGLGATSSWSDAGNWSGGAPLAGDTLVFPQTAQRKTNTNDLAANTSFFRIQFDGSGYDISGNPVLITEDVKNQPGSGSNTLRLDIGGAGDVLQLSGRVVFEGDNTYLGGTSVQGGVLVAADDEALGDILSGTAVLSGATLQVAGGVDLQNEVITVQGTGFDTNGALQSRSGTNFIEFLRLADDTTVGVGNSTLVVEELAQDFSGALLTLVGSGKLQVETAFYAGGLTVESGNLTWNASSQAFVDIHHDGLLRGTGMVSSIEVAGGRVYPGSGNAPGILSVFNATTFSAGRFQVDLDGPAAGTDYGQLKTAGLALNPLATLLEVDLTFVPNAGQVFRVVDNTAGSPVSGTFLNLPEGAILPANGQALQVSYKGGDGNDVTLTALRPLSADLRLTAVASPSPAPAGATLVYTVTVTNHGPDTATTPTVSLGTPVGTTFDSVQGPTGWTCSKPSSSPTVQCVGPAMANGTSAQFIFRFKVNAGAAGPVSATAAVSSNTNDPLSSNNAVNLSTPVGTGGQLPFRRVLPGIAADSAGVTTQG